MKKITFVLALVLSLSLFAACGSKAPAGSGSTASSAASGSQSASTSEASSSLPENLDEIMDKLYDGFAEDELPALPTPDMLEGNKYLKLNEENSESFVGVPRSAYVDGIASEAMMSAVAHSVAVLRAESPEAAQQLAKDVEAGANPRKWVCVEAEKTIVTTVDDVVVLIMSHADTADRMAANLEALTAQ